MAVPLFPFVFGRGNEPRRRFALLVAALCGYGLGFPFLEHVFGIAAGVFYVGIIAIAARSYGSRIGVIVAFLELPLNILLYRAVGYPWTFIVGPPALAMLIVCIFIAWIIGRFHDLQVQLRDEKSKLEAETQLLARAESRIRLIGSVTNDVIWEYTSSKDVLWFSPPFYGRYGVRGSEGRWSLSGWWSLVHPEDQDRVRAEWSKGTASGRSHSLEFRLRRIDGRYDDVLNRWLVVQGTNGQPEVAVGALVDVTALKEAERARAQVATKERELQELQDENRLHSNLLNIASHELNTPLAAMKLALFVHRQAHDASGNEDDVASLDLLDRNVARLSDLIRNTLDVSKLRAGRATLRLQRFDFGALIDEAMAQLAPIADRAQVNVSRSGPVGTQIEGDKDRIFQVLFNLVGNAIKFTPTGGRVMIDYRLVEDEAWCEVTDTGLGLDESQIGRLFQPFSQVHTDATPRPGAGLGLFISRGIVEEHGGRVWCTSNGVGQGATFVFSLPLVARVRPHETFSLA